ncbi:MAG: hypothetical protein WD029_04405, partial [Microthrixaceae bacterium]
QELRSLSEISDASARKTLVVVIANLKSELLLTGTALDPGLIAESAPDSQLKAALLQALNSSSGLMLR